MMYEQVIKGLYRVVTVKLYYMYEKTNLELLYFLVLLCGLTSARM